MISKKFFLKLMPLMIAAAPLQSWASSCIQSERDISKSEKIENFVEQIGGITSLEGVWKLGGLAGAFKRVVIQFESASDGLKALIDGMDQTDPKWGAISVCDTVRSDTLQVKVIKTQDSLYMRMGSGGALQLAQIKNGQVGTFYSFVKE